MTYLYIPTTQELTLIFIEVYIQFRFHSISTMNIFDKIPFIVDTDTCDSDYFPVHIIINTVTDYYY